VEALQMAKKIVKKAVKKAVKKTAAKKNPSKKKVASHLECKCSKKSGGVKIFKNARKNPSSKMGYLGKCDVYNNPNGSVVVVPPDEKVKKVKKTVIKKVKYEVNAKKGTKARKNPVKKSGGNWIKDMNIKKGTLRDYVADKFGKGGFEVSKASGNLIIKPEILTKIAKDPKESEKRKKEAVVAIKFNAMRGKNKKKAKK
jgi:hypothetical protein